MEKINKSFSLGLIGFDKNQKENLLAILSLAERRLEQTWNVTEISDADFFLLSTEKLQSESLITEKKLPRGRCLFCTQQRLPEYEHDVLFIHSGQVPLLSSVVHVLNQAANVSFLGQTAPDNLSISPIKNAQNPVTLDNDDKFFVPEQSFLKHLLANTTEQCIYHFDSPTSGYTLYIDHAKKVYYCANSLKELGSSLRMKDAISINVVLETEWLNTIEQTNLPARPLANLIWYITFDLSAGRLLQGHSDQDNVYLTRWPDLSIEGCGKYVKLAAFMRNNAVGLKTVADKTTVPLGEVYAFYNACYLIGITEKMDSPELHTKVIDEDRQQMLSKITNRLKEINNR